MNEKKMLSDSEAFTKFLEGVANDDDGEQTKEDRNDASEFLRRDAVEEASKLESFQCKIQNLLKSWKTKVWSWKKL